MKHLVMIGGGLAHLRVLHELAASPLPGTRVTLVAHARHVAPDMLAGWITQRNSDDDCCVALAPLARRAGATLIDSDALALDAAHRQVTLANGHTLKYDALSIDCPADPDRDAIAGARENALFHRPIDHFMKLWAALVALSEEQALSVVVIGGEIPAIELALAVHQRLGKRARVALVTGGGAPVPSHPPSFQKHVRRALKRGQVTLFEDTCDAIFGNQMLLGQGMRLACDAPLVALEPCLPRWALESGLALDEQNFLLAGDTLQSPSHPEVFIAGELAVRSDGRRAASGTRLFGKAPPLGLNLRRYLAGGALVSCREPSRGMPLLDVGQGHALAAWGNITVGGRWVGRLKDRADRRRIRRLQVPGSQGVPVASVVKEVDETVV